MILPPLFGLPWERPAQNIASEVEAPAQASVPTPTPNANDTEIVVVMRRKHPNPTWLAPYRQRLKEASRTAAERTNHLQGPERVRAMNEIVRELMRKERVTNT